MTTCVDTRIAYGVHCTWWDSIHEVGRSKSIPTCPHCGGVLYEMPDEATWLAGVPAYEANSHPGYGAMLMWGRGKCFRDQTALRAAYAQRDQEA